MDLGLLIGISVIILVIRPIQSCRSRLLLLWSLSLTSKHCHQSSPVTTPLNVSNNRVIWISTRIYIVWDLRVRDRSCCELIWLAYQFIVIAPTFLKHKYSGLTIKQTNKTKMNHLSIVVFVWIRTRDPVWCCLWYVIYVVILNCPNRKHDKLLRENLWTY